ncbi:MAG: histidine ammonia-lyase [Calditrichaeota bacterium]|nr:histidine ammonia-lyase [Calditrichota bacterium]
MSIQINGNNLTIDNIAQIARLNDEVSLAPEAIEKINASAALIQKLVDQDIAIYGVTTGIGEFARIRVSPEQGSELQRKIIYSHAAGTGDPFPEEVVRAAMVLRANTLSRGNSGVRKHLPETLLEMVNKGVTPVVYEKGSLGTSGDLSPLSQLAVVLLGEGEAFYQGERMPGGTAMEKAGIDIIELGYKEGLGLINGSQVCTGGSALQLVDARNLIKNAFIASAMSIDALKGVQTAYDARIHATRPFNGQNVVARHLRTLMSDSEVIADGSGKVQDGYSMRCTPQVYGPTVDAWRYVHNQVETEMNSTADNPLFFTDDETYLAGGNFHSQNISMAMDFLGIAMAEIANLSERHTNRLMNPVLSGLPDFLIEGKGVNSGLMVAQYTAAALVSENKILAHPAVVDSISVSADQEDHVAMTPIAVRKCGEILRNVGAVLAIEMMSAAQAFDFHKPLKPGKGTRIAYAKIREVVDFMEEDRVLYPDIEKIVALVRDGSIVKAVEDEVGELGFEF